MSGEELKKILEELSLQENEIMKKRNQRMDSKQMPGKWEFQSDFNGIYKFSMNNAVLPEYYLCSELSIQKAPRGVDVPEHRHGYTEMIYVYSGELHQAVNGQKICVKQGEFFLMDTQTVHSLNKLGEKDIAINFLFSNEFWDSILQTFLHDNDIFYRFIVDAIYRKKNARFIHFHSAENENIQSHMHNLLIENFRAGIGSHSVVVGELLIIFSYLFRESGIAKEFTPTHKKKTWFEALNNYIKNNLNEATLTDAAAHLNFNPNYLSTLLKQNTGKNFTELLQDIKLKQACFILENTDYSIEDIVKEVGYSNSTYFYIWTSYGISGKSGRSGCKKTAAVLEAKK